MWQEEGGTKEDSGDLIFTFNHTASPRLTTKLKGVRLSSGLWDQSQSWPAGFTEIRGENP